MSILSKKILTNSLWMMLEKIISMFGLIFVMSYVAKYVGPANFGKIALATTIFAFVQTLTWFGNQEILFKRVSKNILSGLKFLYSTQNLRKLIFTVLSVPILVWLYAYTDQLTFIFGLATALATFILVQDIYVIYNNAVLKSYINTIVNVVGLGIAFAIRWLMVFFELPAEYLAIPIVLVTLIPYVAKRYYFNIYDKAPAIKSRAYTKYYLVAGSALVLSTLSIALYVQITSLMLVKLTSTYELGLYSVASSIGMAWGFVNQSIITSVMSKIYREKNDVLAYSMFAKLNLLVLGISLCAIIGFTLLGHLIIQLLYGEAYLASVPLLVVMAIAGMFSGLGTATARLIIREEGYSYISKKMLCVALCSVPISYFCIQYFGLMGAAYSIALIELLSATLFNYFYKNGITFKVHFWFLYRSKFKNSLEF
ncbi:oligosaccharide flippase family protein [Acinetobacter terrae]|uniref:Oligosaccharide flippase family protein n=1 Tax=Acinetobacter terrae TaxID=2731247 RepID=A0ABX1UZ15_9GAMM|nr:oligosaccharide flippase family protein [Acinetobacter terrae]NNH86651.1 oligosaccharide flippase family protein [Acinetobacter terrae]